MTRPALPEEERHERSFRVRLQDDEANRLIALAKNAGMPPAVLLRAMIKAQLENPTAALVIHDERKAA